MSAPFKVGDLVRLRNPWGPVMTVTCIDEIDGRLFVECVWFDARSRFLVECIAAEVLELAPPA